MSAMQLPVTASFTVPVILLNTFLSFACGMARRSTGVNYGKNSLPLKTDPSEDPLLAASKPKTNWLPNNDPLLVATTAHSNFLENAPFALILSACVELNGGNKKVLTGVLAAFTLARMAHIKGIFAGTYRWRADGTWGSMFVLWGCAGWSAWLVKEYWGF